ncbi:ATP-binding cassette domain-containing protein [Vibrio gazogenes]|uniref:Zinc transport system ATP-binding protein n=1 Tax=Vibrio gazogenes DSM 21264 = NBRC 103151 TaxID=1123492 RepID=A0A1M5HEU3_VIBGA|nr:ATP-binding cassette domain-containing protein [Vibrio gazogenes]USP13600.1 ATP-binding cassette domain-containing protein [Vibrio gazogenes]SHG14464.1 zinc transport system ATP-binding protein [Vibrio gazogenes DSM 21264] [Vibrio gazogenes DSM 21264 = NBRC 103151]SJN55631.1 Zinc import ATP-binding protein ZnuC [Vibrio gazogenes]
MLISSQALSVKFGHNTILDRVNISVSRGEIVTIVGPNGSGKSTLLKTLIGAVSPTSGQVIRSADLKIGYVPQRLHIDETLPMTVNRFLTLPQRHSKEAIRQALARAGVAGMEKQQVMSLSGGQLQRVLLARALLEEPSLLLLDEATQGLDQRGTVDFYQQIDAIRQETGCAVMMVSHDLHVVMRRTDRVICLNGHICCEGVPETVSQSPEYKSLFGLDDDDVLGVYRHQDSSHYIHRGSLNAG